MASNAEEPAVVRPRRPGRPTIADQAKAKGTQPIGDGSIYARDELFAEPGELDEFLEFLRESRRIGMAQAAVEYVALDTDHTLGFWRDSPP